ncbi:MAG: hypothetical protein AAGK21_08160 [Bacteroidota bacterium]
MRFSFLAIALSFAVFTGCSDESPAGIALEEAPALGPLRTLGGEGAPASSSLEDRARALATASFTALAVADEAETWEEMDARYTALLAEASPVDHWALRQAAAFEMADRHFSRGNPSHEMAEAVGRYISFIVNAESPEVDVVAEVLELHAPFMEERLVSELAGSAAAVGRAHLEKNCGLDCIPDDSRIRDLGVNVDQQNAAMARVEEAIVALDEIAQR